MQIAVFTIPFVLIFMSLSAYSSSSKTIEEMNAFNDSFNTVVVERNIDDFLSLYSEQATWIAPSTAPVQGHDEPRALIEFIAAKDGHLSHTIETLFVSPDGTQAVMIGEADVEIKQVGMKATGTYLFVLEKEERNWKIQTDMWYQYPDQ